MPNDAKLGLVIGVGLVIAVSVVFFRQDTAAQASGTTPPAAVGESAPSPPVDGQTQESPEKRDGVAAQPTGRPTRAARRHKIEEGDTLANLAERYLGDSERANEILEANRGVLSSGDDLPVGTEIVIPDTKAPQEPKGDEESPGS